MGTNHLEEIIFEYYDWKNYLVKKNINVGKRKKGGYEMELDIICYNPHTKHLLHIESSLNALSWDKRAKRYFKKFENGRKYIFSEVFTWLNNDQKIDELIIGISKPNNGFLQGIKVITIEDFMEQVIKDVIKEGKAINNAIPQQYPLLRTIQFCFCGCSKKPQI